MQNTAKGTLKIINRNGVISIYVDGLQCTQGVPILDISGYVGNNFYAYDNSVTGLYIDKSMLYSTKTDIDFALLSFCI